MNTKLQKLFEQYNVSLQNKHEINQIFLLLPLDKQRNLINNFEKLILRLEQIEKEINLERRILIWDLFIDIKKFYNDYSEQL